jgi:hypothetical protein
MAINFPNSPSLNDYFESNGKAWTYNGTSWDIVQTPANLSIASGSISATELASNSVTTVKINAGAVTQAKLDSALSAITICTSSTKPGSPFTGQVILETDTEKLKTWDGSSWIFIGRAPADPPTSITVIPTAIDAAISFTSGDDNGSPITNYQYALSTNGGSTYGSYSALSPADASSPITVSGLSAVTSYNVKLKAVNNLGVGVESSSASFTTLALGDFESIATVTVGAGGQATVTFSSIPSTYKHLQIRVIARTDRASTFDGGYVQFNSDTTLSNYTLHVLSGTGSAAVSEGYSTTGGTGLQTPTTGGDTILANTFGFFVMDILDYANTSKYKTIRSIGGFEDNTNARIQLLSGAWLNTAAITSITFLTTAGSSTGTIYTYGVI